MVENKINKLHELISTGMSKNRQAYAISLLNDIIDEINIKDKLIDFKKANKIKIDYDKYEYFVEKCVNLLIALNFSYTDIFETHQESIEFIQRFKDKFKQPLTADYIMTLQRLYKYHCEMMDRKPENLKDLYNAYTEIEDNRKPEL
jgi:hypothetical protein